MIRLILAFVLIGIVVAIAALPEAVKTAAVITTIVLVAFFGWRNAVGRKRMVEGMPTARIATAAKGYVELHGVARNPLTTPLYDPVTDSPCVWFDIHTERLNILRMRWETEGRAKSSRPFAIDDDTALCLIDLEGATMRTPRPSIVRERFTRRHHVRRIVDGQSVYALGHLERMDDTTADGWASQEPAKPPTIPAFERDRRAALLVREWKRDPARRKRIFDPDSDGSTDAAEMENARRLAYAAVDSEVARGPAVAFAAAPTAAVAVEIDPRTADHASPSAYSVDTRPVTHWLRRPDDGKPFVVSALTETELVTKERRAGCLWLGFFLLSAILALLGLADWLGVLAA